MKKRVPRHLREAGYEAIFVLGGYLALSLHPTQRNLDDIIRWIDEFKSRREFLRKLEKRGLIESGEHKGNWVPLLTDQGRAAFAGGRHPEAAWSRPWDGQWRLLTFDLPRSEAQARMNLYRWLRRNHFGRLQGSVWMSPDPVSGLEDVMRGYELDTSQVMVFEGTPAGRHDPRKLASTTWDFAAVDAAYGAYIAFAERTLRSLQKTAPMPSRFRDILRTDRQLWWEAVNGDPLLPKAAHPTRYRGPAAWKVRNKLLKRLDSVRR
ncbi:MAG: hypothetical protein HKN82_01785 [Akkermansiaceae bacterium]|nr:hypothetical protein [Akkermansiaceae bacterium]